MPAHYASLGVVGGLLLLGVLVYSIWTQRPMPTGEDKTRNFNPGAGYDRPRHDDWGNDENQAGPSHRRKRRVKDDSCVICTEALEASPDDFVFSRSLPCGHIFHDKCIMLWFREQRSKTCRTTCPTCRKEV